MSRKRTLVDHGFRLPSAMDNRPLKWEEFLERIGQTVYLSATPGEYELGQGRRRRRADHPPDRADRPRDRGQADQGPDRRPAGRDPRRGPAKNERVLVTTLTKKMAEDLTDYLLEQGVRVRYLHSEVDTLRRVELLRELRQGEYDVLVGINLLREGLDLPEVSLVAILDADKEGFLRSATSLIQTIGRAARNVSGEVHMYADTITPSMAAGDRRDQPAAREAGRLQHRARHRPAAAAQADRRHHRPDRPRGRRHRGAASAAAGRQQSAARRRCRACGPTRRPAGRHAEDLAALPATDLADLIQQLTDQMHAAAAELQFELAARLRDEIGELKKELRGMKRGRRGLTRPGADRPSARAEAAVHVEREVVAARRRLAVRLASGDRHRRVTPAPAGRGRGSARVIQVRGRGRSSVLGPCCLLRRSRGGRPSRRTCPVDARIRPVGAFYVALALGVRRLPARWSPAAATRPVSSSPAGSPSTA